MKAAIYTKYGPPEIVQLEEIDKPIPKDNEVLIKVYATTVNRTDCGFRSAEYFIVRFFSGLLRPNNKTLGNEFAGIIESIGKDVKTFKRGDKVFGYNDKNFGAHAEYMVMDEHQPIITMPDNLTFDEAAAITEGAHYALCDIRAAKIKRGQHILINGATGGIGSAAVQLVNYFGAEVTAVCGTKNISLVKSLGAHVVIDYSKEDFTKINQKFDVVFDAVGKSSFGKCKPILKKEWNLYVDRTRLSFTKPIFSTYYATDRRQKVLFPIPTITKTDLLFLKELVSTGKFKPVIDRSYKLEQIVEAYKYVETGQKTGNVILKIVY